MVLWYFSLGIDYIHEIFLDTLYKENKSKLSISGCTYQGFFSCHKREKFLVHDNEVIVPGTALRVYFFCK